jgi:hypothetical protein
LDRQAGPAVPLLEAGKAHRDESDGRERAAVYFLRPNGLRGVPQRARRRPIMSKNKTDKTAAQQYDNYPDPDAIVHFGDVSEELVELVEETLETSEFLSTSRDDLPETTLLVEAVENE